jgi:hypothetical protein
MALDICESEALADMTEAMELKATIYTHILDRWYWFEGGQIVQGQQKQRKDLQNQLEVLIQEIEKSPNL